MGFVVFLPSLAFGQAKIKSQSIQSITNYIREAAATTTKTLKILGQLRESFSSIPLRLVSSAR